MGSSQPECRASAHPRVSHAAESHPRPRGLRPLRGQVPADPLCSGPSAGMPVTVERRTPLPPTPSTNNEAFLPWLTQPGTGPASQSPGCPGPSTDPMRTPPHPSCPGST